MSLINDALKKAKQAQAQNEPPRTAPEFRAAESDRPCGNNSSLLIVGLLVIAVLIGGALIWLGLSGRKTVASTQTQQSAPAPVSTPPKQAVEALQKPVATAPAPVERAIPSPAIKPTPVAVPPPVVTEIQPASNAAPVVPATPVIIEPPKPDIPKLGGIFFNPTRPSAVLNNKTVYVGSRSGDFIVLAITAQSVTVSGNGQTNVLSLSE